MTVHADNLGVADAATLGVVQGLTEFLPVSSSGHLVLAGHALGFRGSHIGFDVLVHVATLVAVLAYYHRDVSSLATGCLRAGDDGTASRRWFFAITLATIPTGLMGIFGRDLVTGVMQAPRMVAWMLLVTAGLLLLSRRFQKGHREVPDLRIWEILCLGTVQGLAIAPGISRAGITIVTALALGLAPAAAARFSFLLSIPAILGAMVLELGGGAGLAGVAPLAGLVGFVAAAGSGLLALKLLVTLVIRGRLHRFAWYLLPLAAWVLITVP